MTVSRITCEVVRSERAFARAATPSARRDELTALVHRAAAGDERAWTLLVGRFDATVRGLARRYGLCDADRDEVAQRTWMALLRHIDRLGTHPALAGWLVTTARHECLRVLRATRREQPVDEPEHVGEPDGMGVDDQLLETERRDALHRALGGVPDRERRLMELLMQEPPLSYDEISAALGIPKGSIGPTRGRCIARLRGDQHLAGVVRGTFARPLAGHDLA